MSNIVESLDRACLLKVWKSVCLLIRVNRTKYRYAHKKLQTAGPNWNCQDSEADVAKCRECRLVRKQAHHRLQFLVPLERYLRICLQYRDVSVEQYYNQVFGLFGRQLKYVEAQEVASQLRKYHTEYFVADTRRSDAPDTTRQPFTKSLSA